MATEFDPRRNIPPPEGAELTPVEKARHPEQPPQVLEEPQPTGKEGKKTGKEGKKFEVFEVTKREKYLLNIMAHIIAQDYIPGYIKQSDPETRNDMEDVLRSKINKRTKVVKNPK